MKKQNKTKIGVGSVVNTKVGEYHNGGKAQEDEERCGGMFPGCGGEEEVLITIRKCS